MHKAGEVARAKKRGRYRHPTVVEAADPVETGKIGTTVRKSDQRTEDKEENAENLSYRNLTDVETGKKLGKIRKETKHLTDNDNTSNLTARTRSCRDL